jgi:chromosome segregation ATPase
MNNHSPNDKFKQELIDESIKYQTLFKKIESDYKILQNLYNTNIGNLNATVADKEKEIKTLQKQNIKSNIEIGSYTARNHILTTEKKTLQQEHNDLYLKYEDIQTQIAELENKYQEQTVSYNELKDTYAKAQDKNLKDFKYLMNIINFYTSENKNLKEQLEQEKAKQMKDLNEFIQVIAIHNNENISLKQQLEQEKSNFAELQKVLQTSYEAIFKMSQQHN